MQIPRLREWRERRALTQVELAERAGVSERSVAGYEAGSGARPPTVRRLAEALGIEVTDLYGGTEHPLAQAPPSPEQPPLNGFEEERREAAYDLALDAARHQARQDAQAAARALASGRPQAYFMRHDNEALQRLLGYPTDELAGATLEMAYRVVEGEQGPSPLALSLITVISQWQEIISNSPAESAAGAVRLALDLESQLSVLMGDGTQWSLVPPMQRAEIFRLMKLIEQLVERYMARAEVIDIDDLRHRLQQSRESRLRAEARTA